MIRYEPIQLNLGGTEYLLLPKLIPPQLEILSRRLSKIGLKVTGGPTLTGRRPGQTIRISPSGLCWSNRDLLDSVVPTIPDLLDVKKQPARASDVARLYFRASRVGRTVTLRFLLRIESGLLWTKLRRDDACGISPDEHSVITSILSANSGGCEMVTDFPVEGSRVRVIGTKQYYASLLSCSGIASTLRSASGRQERNSYLTESGTVVLDSVKRHAPHELLRVLKGLGEWCYFDPR
jgi:hypothetical protein